MQRLTIEERLERILEVVGTFDDPAEKPNVKMALTGEADTNASLTQVELCDEATSFNEHSNWSKGW